MRKLSPPRRGLVGTLVSRSAGALRATAARDAARALALGAFPVWSACASIACSTGPLAPAAGEGEIGTVVAALSSVGPDGATYSIPAAASLVITGAGVTSPLCEPISGTATQTTSLPAGSYTFYLSSAGCTALPADAGTNVPFTLDRAADGGEAQASSILANPSQLVTVTAGSASSLVFRFTLEQLGALTMTTGNVTTSISFDGGVAKVRPTVGTFVETYAQINYIPTPAYPSTVGINSILSTQPSGGSLTVGISDLSAFVAVNNDQACATFAPTVTTSITNNAGMMQLASEMSAPGAHGQLCFSDPGLSPAGLVTIKFGRSGQVTTPLFGMAMNTPDAGGGLLDIEGEFVALAPAGAYNGALLNLPLFASGTSLGVAPQQEGTQTITISPASSSAWIAHLNYTTSAGWLSLAP